MSAGRPESAPVIAIRDAALRRFATDGVERTGLRDVARDAGCSVGLLQHYFDTKNRLVQAVDRHALDVVERALTEPGADTATPVDDTGDRVRALLSDHPDVVAYLTRAMVDGSPIGDEVFDSLVEIGRRRWQRRADAGRLHPDADVTWAALNGMLVALGAIILRRHVTRHLPEPFAAPEQLTRWEDAVNAMIARGLIAD